MRKSRGLRVKHCENLGRYSSGHFAKLVATAPDGWYVQVWRGGKWYSLLDLCFMRELDAMRAAQSLTAAGLHNHNAIAKAEPLTVKQVAVEFLQW